MDLSITIQRIKDTLDEAVIEVHSQLGQDTVIIAPSGLLEVARLLKEDPELEYNYLMDLTAVDYWKRRPRFEVVYHFLSLKNNFRVRVKIPVPEPDPKVDSLTSLWSAANWYEREVYDMFGIQFMGHPDLRRILMYPEFEGHPLRKDYPIEKRQPLIGPKV
ncbi:MAG: NADH-quinone oxidoreductase subunit C [Acidobacteria bacterium]|nr:NADH-quinone oxidoreductase subunit C [Acidobacteriota bacterium]